jgi:uncharacterized protein
MSQKIFINLPVKDLHKSMEFYTAIGFTNNPQFSDDTAKCMVWSEHISVMLLTPPKFAEFTTKELVDTSKYVAVINSLLVETLDRVETIFERAIKAGGKKTIDAKDYGFMQLRNFEDLDGNLWEIFFMDESKASY